MYEQEVAFYSFHQHNLAKNQYYERFNTKVDIESTIGVIGQHQYLLGYVVQESNIRYDRVSMEEQEDIKKDAK